MKVICMKCNAEYDWNSEDIFNIRIDGVREYVCRNCMKIGKGFRNRRWKLQK